MKLDLMNFSFKATLHIAKTVSGLTLHEISEATGVHISKLKRYFSEEEYYPSPVALVDICIALKSTLPIEWQLIRVKEKIAENSNFNGYFKVSKEISDVVTEITRSLEDGRLTEFERRKLLTEVEEALKELEGLKTYLLTGVKEGKDERERSY